MQCGALGGLTPSKLAHSSGYFLRPTSPTLFSSFPERNKKKTTIGVVGLLLSSWALGRRTAPSPIVHPHPLTRRLLWDVCPYVFESFCGAFPVMRCNLSPSVFPRGVCVFPSLSGWFRVVGPHLPVCVCFVFCESPKWQAWFLGDSRIEWKTRAPYGFQM